jgi:K+-transporting ATPase ATPase B chain
VSAAPVRSARRAAAPRVADAATVRAAVLDSFRKLDPRRMASNPVMFVVEVGSVLVTALLVTGLGEVDARQSLFRGLVAVWLWGTVLFANFAEALAEGRGKAQAADLRATRRDTTARRLNP